MIRFDILTIFPEAVEPYMNSSMLKAAQIGKRAAIFVRNLRDWGIGSHKKVDERPYGGGPGMVFRVEPIVDALKSLKLSKGARVVFFSPAGKTFDSKTAAAWATGSKRIVCVAGHYEGIDERVKKIAKDMGFKVEEISVGPYVLTGGEIPAMIVVDAVLRHVPGVLGHDESLEEKRHGVGVPMYTRPEVFEMGKKKYKVPDVLKSGNHAKIDEWRRKQKMVRNKI